jgi:hypothetical protein
MKKRASYFFVIDVFIGSAILVLTLIIIFSSRVNSPPPDASYRMAEDFMEFLSTTEFRDFGSPYKLNLTRGGYINDSTQSLLQVIASLQYYQYRNDSHVLWSQILTRDIVNGVVPPQYGVQVLVNGTEVFGQGAGSYSTFGTRPKNDTARIVLSARRISYIKVRDANGNSAPAQFFTEVKLWA